VFEAAESVGVAGPHARFCKWSSENAPSTLWECEEAMRATEGASYWLRAFGAEAASGEVSGLERYEVVSSEARRAWP
jgi:hypothetical protein